MGKYSGTVGFHRVYAELIQAAGYRGVVTYTQIARLGDLPLTGNVMGKAVGDLLGEITRQEIAEGRPMLSALAVNSEGKASEGFFALAKELGRLTDDSKEAREALLVKERKATYDAWRLPSK